MKYRLYKFWIEPDLVSKATTKMHTMESNSVSVGVVALALIKILSSAQTAFDLTGSVGNNFGLRLCLVPVISSSFVDWSNGAFSSSAIFTWLSMSGLIPKCCYAIRRGGHLSENPSETVNLLIFSRRYISRNHSEKITSFEIWEPFSTFPRLTIKDCNLAATDKHS